MARATVKGSVDPVAMLADVIDVEYEAQYNPTTKQIEVDLTVDVAAYVQENAENAEVWSIDAVEGFIVLRLPFDAEAFAQEHFSSDTFEIGTVVNNGELVSLTAEINLEGSLQEAVDQIDLTGMGSDGESEYTLSDSDIEVDGDSFTVTISADRDSGKFAPNEEFEARLTDALNEVEGLTV